MNIRRSRARSKRLRSAAYFVRGSLSPSLRSEWMLNPEPELPGKIAIDGLRDVEAQSRAFDQAEPGDIHAQADAEGVANRTERMPVHIGVADVVERRRVNIAHAGDVIDVIPLAIDGD